MLTKIAIAGAAFLVVAGVANAAGWQPSWAADPIPLVPGQEYRTGSPLSKPGLGLFGAIAESLIGGDNFSGGGTVRYTGQGWENTTTLLGGPTQAPQMQGGVNINGQRYEVLSPQAAQEAQDGVDWSAVENTERWPVPGVPGRSCGRSRAEMMQDAIRLYDEGVTAFDCDGNPIAPNTPSQNCPAGQRLFTITVPDERLGARLVYLCQ